MAKIVLLVACCLLIASCSKTKIVNKIELIQTIGVDLSGKSVKSTMLAGNYKKKGESGVQLLGTKSDTNLDMMSRINAQTRNPIEYGQLRMLLYGKEYSRKGIADMMQNLCHDSKLSTRMQLGVTDKEASDILAAVAQSEESYFLSDMIEHHIKNGTLPHNNLQIALFNYYGKGRDLFLPYLKLTEGKIVVDGLALFKDDKYVTKINMQEAFLLKMLIENSDNGTYLASIRATEQQSASPVLLHSISSKVKYSLNRLHPQPSLSVLVHMDAQIKYVPDWIDPTSSAHRSMLENELGSYFEQVLQALLSLCKKHNVDPAGLGDFVRSRSIRWNEQEFQASYPQMQTQVTVKLKIVETGVSL
ncbi:Ger(x)C family spore germination protein [Paenibacillus sp. H1-7]|uniref:Ger(x)C family spore germination protein n=1 Tax=Paenibacillus sp. H1-7 TaxID=2282849 RepID=UPI001EF9B263|nr:Ger(x)C family spore germination protein [Paenibacillus sp. H1-7]